MEFRKIAGYLKGIPHMSAKQGRVVYHFIKKNRIRNVLELGFAHGVSSCYMAAALDESGTGTVTAIDMDNPVVLEKEPNIYTLLERTGLQAYVRPILAPSYIWELMRMIEEQTVGDRCTPIFDFCYIDGAHTWKDDGFAFMLVDKLLNPGGWILFDDINWTYSKSPTLANKEWVKKLPEIERTTPQVKKVFDLLVRQHPDYRNCRIDGAWGWAQKR